MNYSDDDKLKIFDAELDYVRSKLDDYSILINNNEKIISELNNKFNDEKSELIRNLLFITIPSIIIIIAIHVCLIGLPLSYGIIIGIIAAILPAKITEIEVEYLKKKLEKQIANSKEIIEDSKTKYNNYERLLFQLEKYKPEILKIVGENLSNYDSQEKWIDILDEMPKSLKRKLK